MQQTLLSILAMMIVGSFTFNQQRDFTHTYGRLVDDELEIAASGVAEHVMELIGNRSFDERTLPETVNEMGLPTGDWEMSSTSSFGKSTGCDLDEPYRDTIPCMDVDDANMAPGTWQEVPFRLKDGKELPFEVNVEVFYVDPSHLDTPLPAGSRSMHKKVVVRIRSKIHAEQNRYPDGFVRLERIYSYDEKRAKNRFAARFGDATLPAPPPPDEAPPPEVTPPPADPPTDPGTNADEPDPNSIVTVCHRSISKGKIKWSTKNVKYKFLEKHIQHGDYTGACHN
jgi:hypothetical protein